MKSARVASSLCIRRCASPGTVRPPSPIVSGINSARSFCEGVGPERRRDRCQPLSAVLAGVPALAAEAFRHASLRFSAHGPSKPAGSRGVETVRP
jgi:hypothetical protein